MKLEKKYLDINVYEALQNRFDFIFREFDNIYVSFSGGKDSGLLLHLIMDYMQRNKIRKRIGVFHQDFEAQYELTTEYVEKIFEMYLPRIEPFWVCLPMAVRTAMSNYQMYWYQIHANRKTICLLGMRADESLTRYNGFLNKKYAYEGQCWISEQFKGVYTASPMYDWSTSDVWTAYAKFHYPYNKLYDLYQKAGLKPSQMRVASPFNDYAKEALNLYRVLEPQTWTKLVGRVQGANFTSIYAKTKAMGYRNITLPEGHTWKSYTMFLLDTLPVRLRDSYLKKFQTSMDFWHNTGGGLSEETIRELEEKGYQIARNGVSNYTLDKKSRVIFLQDIPDDTDDIKTTRDVPSWKRMCYCILKNDHLCRFMGFGLLREDKKRVEMIREKDKGMENL